MNKKPEPVRQKTKAPGKAEIPDLTEIFDPFSDLLLKLYHDAGALPEDAFQAQTFARFREIVPFDAGWWGVGVLDASPDVEFAGVQIFDLYADNLSEKIFENYDKFKQYDTFALAAARSPGVTLNANVREWFPMEYWPYLDIFGYRQALTTLQINPLTGLTMGITLYRKNPLHPFSERERRIKQALMPHWVAALSRARIEPWMREKAYTLQYPGVAIVDGAGRLHYAEGNFGEMLQMEWPAWRGPDLPPPLRELLLAGREGYFSGARIAVKTTLRRDMGLVQVRTARLADQLSEQQLKVARYSAEGLSFKEIARRMQLSPATVRSYLTNIYRRLGVKNKIQLAEALRETE